MQGSEPWNLAVWRVGRNEEIGAIKRPKFPTVEAIRLLAYPVCHAHEDHAFVIFLDRNNEARAWFGLGVNVVGEVASDDFASRGFRPPAHQAFSNSKRLLRTEPPLAFGADFFT